MPEYTVQTPSVHQFTVKSLFQKLSLREKLYAHHLSCAAWKGTRIILRQVSEESPQIFDFIRELSASCCGDWDILVNEGLLQGQELTSVLEYFATFLSNVGNYYGFGGQKFVPAVAPEVLERIAQRSQKASELYRQVSSAIFQLPPYAFGFPSSQASSAYYPGELPISQNEVVVVSQALERQHIFSENTRVRKLGPPQAPEYQILRASTQKDVITLNHDGIEFNGTIKVVGGDHCEELVAICDSLEKAIDFAADETQRATLNHYIKGFQTGDIEDYRDAQRSWINDKSPKVENVFGFVETYRDSHGARAEFEAIVGINDYERTRLLYTVVEQANVFIRTLPWASGQVDNDGKGPFEKSLLEHPDLSSIHTLAYNSSVIFNGINLPNYNDIRQDCGFKNIIIENRMAVVRSRSCFLDIASREAFQCREYWASYLQILAHEILGHGTGKLLTETTPGEFNFNPDELPIHPVDNRPIRTWYKPGQTWKGQFRDLASPVEECRAELVGVYMMDNSQYLKLFGFDENSDITAESLTYAAYQLLAALALQNLADYNTDIHKWGQAHSRARFAMLKCLLRDGNGCVEVVCNDTMTDLHVEVDESKILKYGKPALARMLLRLHVFRCTADVGACREYFEDLSSVSGEFLAWREIVLKKGMPPLVFSQANTYIEGGDVLVKEYEPTFRGIIQSWMDRQV